MSETVIRVENLSKKYVLSHQQEGQKYKALRDVIANGAKSLGRKLWKPGGTKTSDPTHEEFWALKDVAFEIKQGDRIGIIGRNGAGKSTLLKVLSRITEPTQGSIKIKGRVASLLEVGTGFHPELTGRENIFLNGAILGMSKEEIKRKFDEIVDFAEVEKFLDTPVKRYSSGMYVRLAFAVAAHLEPEILIVDEVLAVGDAQFQKKCLGKMEDVGREGRTVLFVSHNMSTIQSLCTNCLLLKNGSLALNTTPTVAVQSYLQDSSASDQFIRPPQQNGRPTIVFGKLIYASSGLYGIQLNLEIFSETAKKISLELRILDSMHISVGFGSLGTFNSEQMIELSPGNNSVSFYVQTNYLAVGTYYVSLDLTLPFIEYYDRAESCFAFEITRSSNNGSNNTKVLNQSWGHGAWEIPLNPCSKHENSLV